ncbi:MAG: hypothetical protein ACYTEQ_20435 [Planctomycetota bacterium]|jgi:hypothetical protein
MFGFFAMEDTYEERAIARYEEGDLIVDTCRVTDASQPFETGVCHPAYNGGTWVIVEMYETREEAQAGHDQWVATMTADKLPESLVDVGTAGIAEMLDAVAEDTEWRIRNKE